MLNFRNCLTLDFSLLFFKKRCLDPKEGQKSEEVPTDSVLEFELGDSRRYTVGREETVARKREEEAQKQRKEAKSEGATHSPEEGVAEKHTRTEKSDTELDTYTEGGGDAGTSQSHYNTRKGT